MEIGEANVGKMKRVKKAKKAKKEEAATAGVGDKSVEAADRYLEYDAESKAAANADHVSLEGCQLATQATRAIASGEEVAFDRKSNGGACE